MTLEKKFSRGINSILPVQCCPKKFSASFFTQITSTTLAVPSPCRGVSRSSRTRDGMRWTQGALLTSAHPRGRRSRVVLTPRRRRQVGESDFTGDGGNKARSPRRARRKPLKPLRAGMPGVPVYLWRLTRMLSLLHARLRVQRAPGIPRALISDGAKRSGIIRAYRAAGSRRHVLTSLRASRSNRLLLPFCLMESSLSLAMTVG
jgi:hypothetical protein